MSAPAPAPHLRLKCRLHPCPAYRVLPASPASNPNNIPTLAQIREQAISAWQLPSSAGFLIAVRDEDGDEVVICGEGEWEGLLASLPGARTGMAQEVLLRLALHRDPQPHAAPSLRIPSAPVKSAMDERNDALAASFEDMLSRARSMETAPGRARAYADRFYAVSRGPTLGEGEGSSGSGDGGAVPVNTGAGAGPRKEEEEGGKKGKGKEDWRVRADQLYGSLVAVRPRPPPATTSPAAATATEPPQHSDEPSSTAPAAAADEDDEGEVTAKQEGTPSPSIPPAHNPEGQQPDTDGTSTSQEQESRPSAEPEGSSGRRPKRPVEEVNAELSSAWEIMLSRMRG